MLEVNGTQKNNKLTTVKPVEPPEIKQQAKPSNSFNQKYKELTVLDHAEGATVQQLKTAAEELVNNHAEVVPQFIKLTREMTFNLIKATVLSGKEAEVIFSSHRKGGRGLKPGFAADPKNKSDIPATGSWKVQDAMHQLSEDKKFNRSELGSMIIPTSAELDLV